MSSLKIRRALSSDLMSIAHIEINSAVYEHRLEPLSYTLEQMYQIWYQRLVSGSFYIFVAIIDEQIVGFIGVQAPKNKNGFIQAIYIDPLYFRSGIGSALLNEAEKVFVQNHCHMVKLYVEPLNKAATRFYLKAGFKQVPDQKFRHLNIFVKEISC